jgi:hypothetical protein
VLFLPGDSRWHGFQPITGKKAREKQTKNKKPSPLPKKTRNKRTKLCVACGRLSLLFKQTKNKKSCDKRPPPKKEKKKPLQHTRARTTKRQNTTNKQKTHKEEEKAKESESQSNETTRDAHVNARSRTHARTRARERRRGT